LFREEQYLPSSVIDRGSLREWQDAGRQDTFTRAKARDNELVSKYQRPELDLVLEKELRSLAASLARQAGMDALPKI
jgi:trimethylamine:corrinoid methyltransferase-like protein